MAKSETHLPKLPLTNRKQAVVATKHGSDEPKHASTQSKPATGLHKATTSKAKTPKPPPLKKQTLPPPKFAGGLMPISSKKKDSGKSVSRFDMLHANEGQPSYHGKAHKLYMRFSQENKHLLKRQLFSLMKELVREGKFKVISDEQLRDFVTRQFAKHDINQDEGLRFDEFMNFFNEWLEESAVDLVKSLGETQSNVEEIFMRFDADHNSALTEEELRQLAIDALVKRVIGTYDKNKDNQLSFDEFQQAYNALVDGLNELSKEKKAEMISQTNFRTMLKRVQTCETIDAEIEERFAATDGQPWVSRSSEILEAAKLALNAKRTPLFLDEPPGWKNSLKGVGYFLGSALISVSYELALGVMMGLVLAALPFAIFGLDRSLGTTKKKNYSLSDVFVMNNHNLNWLSFARCFLFASRDFWFEVPLPFFLRSPRCEGLGVDSCAIDDDCGSGAACSDGVCRNLNTGGGCGGFGWGRVVVGAILASYIVLYGQIQSWSPQLVLGPLRQTPPNKLTEVLWGLINCIPTLTMSAVFWSYASEPIEEDSTTPLAIWLMTAVVCFAAIFAVNSSIHSFLVVFYAKEDKVATSVGFYYMSNACGRLLGTLGSGVLYTYIGEEINDSAGPDAVSGIAACFVAATISSLAAALITLKIEDEASGLRCGPLACIGAKVTTTKNAEPAASQA